MLYLYQEVKEKTKKPEGAQCMFMIIRAYNDFTSSTEHANDIVSALNASAIYLEDPNCWMIKIIEVANGKVIMDYWRN